MSCTGPCVRVSLPCIVGSLGCLSQKEKGKVFLFPSPCPSMTSGCEEGSMVWKQAKRIPQGDQTAVMKAIGGHRIKCAELCFY